MGNGSETYIPIPQTYQDSSCMFSSSIYSPSPSQPREDNNNNNNNLSIYSELNKAFFEIVLIDYDLLLGSKALLMLNAVHHSSEVCQLVYLFPLYIYYISQVQIQSMGHHTWPHVNSLLESLYIFVLSCPTVSLTLHHSHCPVGYFPIICNAELSPVCPILSL